MAMTLRLAEELHAKAQAEADEMGVSMNAFIALALDNYIRWRAKTKRHGFRQVVVTDPHQLERLRRTGIEIDADLDAAITEIERRDRPHVIDKSPASSKALPVKVEAKLGRNDPCPCGSGQKYKRCHGAGDASL